MNVNDACVDLTLTLAVDGYPTQTLHGTATSLDGGLGPIVVGDLDGMLVIPLPATHGVPSSGCQGGNCTDVPLEITLRGLRIRLESDAARTTLLPQSRLVGFIYYGDRSSAYSALGPSSLESGLAAFATQAGLTSTYATELSTAFASAVDLHMDSDGELGRCTGATLTTLDANAISFTLNLAGTAP